MPSSSRPSSGGANSKYFIGHLKAKFFWVKKTFPKATGYFNVKFYFSNTCLNSVEHIYYFPQQKIKWTDEKYLKNMKIKRYQKHFRYKEQPLEHVFFFVNKMYT